MLVALPRATHQEHCGTNLHNAPDRLRPGEPDAIQVAAHHSQVPVLVLGRDGELGLHARRRQLQTPARRRLVRCCDGEAGAGEGWQHQDRKRAALQRVPLVQVGGRDHVHRRQAGVPFQLRSNISTEIRGEVRHAAAAERMAAGTRMNCAQTDLTVSLSVSWPFQDCFRV